MDAGVCPEGKEAWREPRGLVLATDRCVVVFAAVLVGNVEFVAVVVLAFVLAFVAAVVFAAVDEAEGKRAREREEK